MLLFVNEYHLLHHHRILPLHEPSLLCSLKSSSTSAQRHAMQKKKKKKKKKTRSQPSSIGMIISSSRNHGNCSADMASCTHVDRSSYVMGANSFVSSLFSEQTRSVSGSVLNSSSSSSSISLSVNSSSSAKFSVENSSEEDEEEELEDSLTSSSSSSSRRRRRKRDAYPMESLAMDSITADQIKEENLWYFRHGPLPGDLAEVETFCRIFRVAEQVHNVVMEALCTVNDSREHTTPQSSVYNGISLGDVEPLNSEDVPLLEEKVVSSLGCIGALLYQQKQEVLSGRLNHGSSPGKGYNIRPPLAQFRANMKKCCEQLEALLLCYFPIHDDQFKLMHKKFQKLQNICFDAGYPRAKGSPNHADIPNWGAVKLETPWNEKVNSDIAFWRGGQLTDDGVDWLIKSGFKCVVDLRTEPSQDYLSKSAMDAAVSSGKLKKVMLPVEPGNVPTKDQVLDFAKLVADVNNQPLYLHSQQGVGRTSAMVTKWREVGLEIHVQEAQSSITVLDNETCSVNGDQELVVKSENKIIEKVNIESLVETSGSENHHPLETLPMKTDILQESTMVLTPFESQRPPKKSFSQRDMSNFLKGRKIVPASFNRRLERVSSTVIHRDETAPITETAEPAGRWCLDGPGIPRAGKVEGNYRANSKGADNGNIVKDEQEKYIGGVTNGAPTSSETPVKGALNRIPGTNGALGVDDGDDDAVVGDMCASTTGVVRVQSRKKAEMYLVRTDGFSCTRERVKESTLAFTHPSTQQQMLMWKTAPKTVLLLKKLGSELIQETELVASFLHYQEGMNVIVEPDVHDHLARVAGFGFIQTFHSQDISLLHERVDFVVCLGGDGVILHASNLFRDAVPPVVSFNLGSLGFLTAHPFEDFMPDLKAIIHGNTRVEGVYITLRMRLQCEIFRNDKPVPGKVFDVLNEVVVDRGSNPYLCKIECYERNRLITKVQADGVIVATPTGSTAYSTAAGGSMVHPNVPCMLFTPICPHSLSFRPVILPDSALLELKVPEDARSNAWVSFDGKRRQQLSRGDSVRICMSQHPLPTINKSDQTDDWFRSLVRCLNWNERLEQKAL